MFIPDQNWFQNMVLFVINPQEKVRCINEPVYAANFPIRIQALYKKIWFEIWYVSLLRSGYTYANKFYAY